MQRKYCRFAHKTAPAKKRRRGAVIELPPEDTTHDAADASKKIHGFISENVNVDINAVLTKERIDEIDVQQLEDYSETLVQSSTTGQQQNPQQILLDNFVDILEKNIYILSYGRERLRSALIANSAIITSASINARKLIDILEPKLIRIESIRDKILQRGSPTSSLNVSITMRPTPTYMLSKDAKQNLSHVILKRPLKRAAPRIPHFDPQQSCDYSQNVPTPDIGINSDLADKAPPSKTACKGDRRCRFGATWAMAAATNAIPSVVSIVHKRANIGPRRKSDERSIHELLLERRTLTGESSPTGTSVTETSVCNESALTTSTPGLMAVPMTSESPRLIPPTPPNQTSPLPLPPTPSLVPPFTPCSTIEWRCCNQVCQSTELEYNAHSGYVVCLACGIVQKTLSSICAQSESKDASGAPEKASGYRPPNHMAEIIAQFQATRRTLAPVEIVDYVQKQVEKYGIPPNEVTVPVVHSFLKRLKGGNQHYKYCTEIASRISHMPAPHMDPMQEELVVMLFPLTVHAYMTSPRYLRRKANRVGRIKDVPNNMNYNYVFYKLCELCSFKQFLPYIKLPKSIDNIIDNDENGWKHVCAVNGWRYMPTR
jgi:hypothetical protein